MKLRAFIPTLLVVLSVSACGRGGLFFEFLSRNVATLGRASLPAPMKTDTPARPEARLAALWVGHATTLVQIEDRFILTDPVFTESVGQISRRIVQPGLDVQDLPPIDAVLVSHLHFDHLSLGSLDLIEHATRRIFLPEGGGVYVPSARVPTIELPSWQSYEVDGLRVTSVPVKHNGWRYSGDREWMTRSYTGYVVEYRGISVYFGGDTGYTRAFETTRRRFPNLDLAILPIAPIHPRDFMCRNHTDPAEALQAFNDLGARYLLAMHYDTFVNSLDEYGEAPRALRALLKGQGLDERRVAILVQGEQRVFLE